MVQFRSSMGGAHSNSHNSVDALVADVLVSEVSDFIEQLFYVEMVSAVPRDVRAEAEVILTEDFQASASVLEEGCEDTVDLTEGNADFHDPRGEAVTIQNFRRGSCTVVHVSQITDRPYQLRPVSLDHMDII